MLYFICFDASKYIENSRNLSGKCLVLKIVTVDDFSFFTPD